MEPVLDGDYVVWEYDVRGGAVAFVRITATEPADLWVLRPGGEATRVTRFNEVVREYRVSEPRYFRFTASDGAEIEGWVIEPVDRVGGRRYPAILWVHGGPKSKFGFGSGRCLWLFVNSCNCFLHPPFLFPRSVWFHPSLQGLSGETLAPPHTRIGV